MPQVGGQAIQTDRLDAVPLAPYDTGGLGTAITRDLISHRLQCSKTTKSNFRKLEGGMNQRCNLKESSLCRDRWYWLVSSVNNL